MVQLAADMNWSYTLLVHSNDSYGRSGAAAIKALAKNYSICISNTITVDNRQGVRLYKEVARQIREDPATGIIYFGQETEGTPGLLCI